MFDAKGVPMADPDSRWHRKNERDSARRARYYIRNRMYREALSELAYAVEQSACFELKARDEKRQREAKKRTGKQ